MNSGKECMPMEIELNPELGERLTLIANSPGISLDELADRLLREHFAALDASRQEAESQESNEHAQTNIR
jgi:hypothetical protein